MGEHLLRQQHTSVDTVAHCDGAIINLVRLRCATELRVPRPLTPLPFFFIKCFQLMSSEPKAASSLYFFPSLASYPTHNKPPPPPLTRRTPPTRHSAQDSFSSPRRRVGHAPPVNITWTPNNSGVCQPWHRSPARVQRWMVPRASTTPRVSTEAITCTFALTWGWGRVVRVNEAFL